MSRNERIKTVAVLAVFAVLFLTLSLISFKHMSASFDEPDHLTSGYFSWKAGDYRIDPDHPPFLRMWATLPLLAQHEIKLPPQSIDRIDPLEWVLDLKKIS